MNRSHAILQCATKADVPARERSRTGGAFWDRVLPCRVVLSVRTELLCSGYSGPHNNSHTWIAFVVGLRRA